MANGFTRALDSTAPAPFLLKSGRTGFYLHPGRVFASSEPHQVTTVLGSCVAVCIWDPRRAIGGVTHYQLPSWAGGSQSSTKFGNVAVTQLIDRLLQSGGIARNLRAKVFGGACVLEAFRNAESHLGAMNVQMAETLLADAGIPIVARDVGGHKGRKLVFQTDDGAAWVKSL